MDFLNRTWAEINLDALENNFNKIKAMVGDGVKVMCVVKANAYCHGVKQIVKQLKADYFAVSNIEEAVEIRREGVFTPILILGYTPVKFAKELAQYNITQTLLSFDYAKALQQSAKGFGVTVNCHIKIDTGMNRLGFEYDDSRLAEVCKWENLSVEGIFTHFASSDKDGDKEGEFTKGQFEKLLSAISLCEKDGFKFKLRHACNSAATVANPEYHLDMVRAGIVLYGLEPSGEIDIKGFKPVMRLCTIVAQIKEVDIGETISYGRTYKADKKVRIATLPIGYADGYIRALGNKAEVVINGQRAPIVGRICMDQCMCDVTNITANEGDTVTLFGDSLPIEEVAKTAGTINYEILCLVSNRVGKVYLKNGKAEAKCGLLG